MASEKNWLSGLISLCVALSPLEPAFAAIKRSQVVAGAAMGTAPALPPASFSSGAALQSAGAMPALPAPAPIAESSASAAPEARPAAAVPEAAAGASADVGAALQAMPEAGSASVGGLYQAGIDLESAVSGAAVGKLTRRPDGGWRALRRDDGGLMEQVRASLRHLRKGGIDVPYQTLSLIGAVGLAAEGEGSSRLLLGRQELGHLEELARSQGLTLSDKLAQALVRRHLEEGIVEPLRFSREESAALGLDSETALTAAQAIEVYGESWRKQFESFLRQLGFNSTPPSPDQYLLQGRRGKIVAACPDPGSKSLILVRSNGLVERRGIDDHGKIEEKRTILHRFAAGVEAAYFDPVSRRLGIVPGRGKIISINIDDPRSDRGHVVIPFESFPILYDPLSRTLVTRHFETIGLWTLSQGGAVADEPFQIVRSPKSVLVTAAAVDRKGGDFGTLVTLGVTGLVEIRPFQADGRAQEEPIQSFSAAKGDWDDRLAVDSDSRLLYLYSSERRDVMVLSINADGSVNELSVRLLPIPEGLPPVSGIHIDSRSRSLLVLAGNSHVLRYDVQAHLAPTVLPKELLLDTLAFPLPDADVDLTRSILRAVASAGINRYGVGFVRDLSIRVMAPDFLQEATKTTNLRVVPDSLQWFQDAEAVLRRRMPSLRQALQNPVKLGGLLSALSLLRLMFPYDMANTSARTALAFAREAGLEFKWQGLNVVPVSESFRRHILYTHDEEGLYAVELKMPGEDADRSVIQPAHFEGAQELWQRYPADPGVVKPLFYGQYKGKARMYGRPFDFGGAERLGVMVYEYRDGKRLTNSRGSLSERDYLRALVGPVAAAIRLHDLGWSGTVWGPGMTTPMTDMHSENIRLLDNGQALLAGDFGTFERRTLTLEQRQSETLGLLGLTREGARDKDFSAFLNSLAPLVIERFSNGVSDSAERETIRARVRVALGAAR